jgi:nucleotide-binding universal stress UspA family protein
VSERAAHGIDLVAMGAHGRTATSGLVFGSVTNTVLASCKTPLLVLRDSTVATARAQPETLRIGIAVDGSKYSVAAARYVVRHRSLFGHSLAVTLIHVVPDLLTVYLPGLAQMPVPMFSPEQAAESQAASFEAVMAPMRALFKRAGVLATELRLVDNGPGDAIARYASENKLDLLVMGSHGYGALKALVLGSVATRVAARCKTPLLLIRA